MVAGLSQRQAYIEAGYATKGKSDNYIDKEASNLFKNRKVYVRYQELMEEHKAKALRTRKEAVEELKWLIEKSKYSIEVIDGGYVRQGTSNALLGAIKELNDLEGVSKAKEQSFELNKVKMKKMEAEIEALSSLDDKESKIDKLLDQIEGALDE